MQVVDYSMNRLASNVLRLAECSAEKNHVEGAAPKKRGSALHVGTHPRFISGFGVGKLDG